ncbi:hypothetical protein [Streptomyces griseoviridis]|uniref:hypothetical protein n=1 Tax=Streptomyces griseoviridis TaxID=45398 RepID=UPI003453B8D2
MLALRLSRGAHPAVQLRRLMVVAASAGTGFLLLCTMGYAMGHPDDASTAALLRLAWCLTPLAATVYLAVAVARTDPGARPRSGLAAVGLGPAGLMAVSAVTTALSCVLGSLLAMLVFLHLRGDLNGMPFDGAAAQFLAAGRPLPLPAALTLLVLVPASASLTVALALRPREPRTPAQARPFGRFGAYGRADHHESFGSYGRFGARRRGPRTGTPATTAMTGTAMTGTTAATMTGTTAGADGVRAVVDGVGGPTAGSGTHGLTSTPGHHGVSGTADSHGLTSTPGHHGVPGLPDSHGLSDTAGTKALTGTNGTTGTTGATSTGQPNGTPGTAGAGHTNGTNGTTGTVHTNGAPGTTRTPGTDHQAGPATTADPADAPHPDAVQAIVGLTDLPAAPRPAPSGLPWGIATLAAGLAVESYAGRAAAGSALPMPGGLAGGAPAVLLGWVLTATGLALAGPGLTHLCGRLLQAFRPGALRLLAGRVLMDEASRIGRPLGVVCAVASGGYAMSTLYDPSGPAFGPLTLLGTLLVAGCAVATLFTAAVEARQSRADTTAALVRLGAPAATLRSAAAVRAGALLALFGPLTLAVAQLAAMPLTR